MHQSFSLMQKLASEYFPDSFCKATLFALSQFNDNCSLVPKPNMLLFVENLMKLFGDFLFVIYDIGAGGLTESKDGTEEVFGSFHSLDLPVLWCEVWKFVKNVLLSASVWAKKSNATRGTIRKILPGIFDLTTFLLDYPPPLITESSQLYSTKNNSSTSLLTIIFFESLIETFPWFSALNKYYRSESVDLACRMLIYAANKANWEIPHDITKQLEGLATGQIASQLDEPEKKRLIMWNTEVVDEEEEVEEKVAAANSTFSSSAEHHNPLRASFNSTTNELVSSTSPSSYSTSSSRPQKIEYYSGYELSGKSANIPSMYKEVDSAWLQMAKARKLSQSTMKKSSKKSGVKSSAMKLLRSEVLSSTTAPRVKSSSFPAQIYSSASSNASLSLAPRFKVEVLEPSADLSAFHDSLTPEKPKRSMQVIDLPNSKKSATERRLEEKTVAAFKPKPLGDISSLHMQILSWEFPPEDKLLTPPNFDSDSLKSIRKVAG